MSGYVKVAVTIPSEDFQRLEKLRKKLKSTRSELVASAVRGLIAASEQQQLIDQYVEGYKKVPEQKGLLKALENIQSLSVAEESWD